jgi:hypothetical protein
VAEKEKAAKKKNSNKKGRRDGVKEVTTQEPKKRKRSFGYGG